MSKKDLIDEVAAATELPKDKAALVVDAVIQHIEKMMKNGEELRIAGFGTFKVANRKERKARNPQTGAEITMLPRARALTSCCLTWDAEASPDQSDDRMSESRAVFIW